MALMRHEAERLHEIMNLILDFAENDMRAKQFLQNILNNKSEAVSDDTSRDGIDSQEQQFIPEVVEKIVEVPIEKIVEIEKIVHQDRIVEKPVDVVPTWVDSLVPFIEEIEFFEQVKQESNLADILLPNQSDNLKQLVINASQWGNILRVWDELASEVKNNQVTITDRQLAILSHCLALFNLTLSNRHAHLHSPTLGDSYDFNTHEQVIGNSDTIASVLLPSLYNAGDEAVRPALIATR